MAKALELKSGKDVFSQSESDAKHNQYSSDKRRITAAIIFPA
jgi:hypothetical protein